ncbi:unnamed protein product [Caenorhabditis sp. 36 PRJEB53466]|nr:unnamed protein product [Caenorhabditis sp. 36 PRJEB53466]
MERPRANLLEMPLHVKESILQQLDFKSRCAMRKCAYNIQKAVDTMKVYFVEIIVIVLTDKISCIFADRRTVGVSVEYTHLLQGCSVKSEHSDGTKTEHILHNTDFVVRAVQDLEQVLKNQKVRIGQLSVHLKSYTSSEVFVRLLLDGRTCEHLKVVKLKIELDSQRDYAMRLIGRMRADTLKVIKLVVDSHLRHFEEMSRLEQWQAAKRFKLKCLRTIPDLGPIGNFLTLRLGMQSITANELKLLIMTFIQSEVFINCRMTFERYPLAVLRECLGSDTVQFPPFHRGFTVPETGNKLKVTAYWDRIYFERVSTF